MAEGDPFRIDVDVHVPQAPMADLLPWLDDYFRQQVTDREIDQAPFRLSSYPTASPLTRGAALAELPLTQALDKMGTGLAVVSDLHGVIALHNPDMRAALVSAVNDHLRATWLDADPRLRGSIYVSMEEPEAAVREIERLAPDGRFVQVLVLAGQEAPHGSRRYWPIWEAAERHGLALAIHAGGLYRLPPSVAGWPAYQFEDYVLQSQIFENILVALLGEGVFQKFPGLRVVFLECGFTWLPTALWRMDKTWRGTRQEVPWLDRPPSEILRGRVFLSLQPCEPPSAEALATTLQHLGGSDMLLYASDWPHRQFDGEEPLPRGFAAEDLPGILHDNARRAYPRLAQDLALPPHEEVKA